MTSNREKGKIGEACAREFYEARGYEVVAQNVFCRYGEIDLIVKNEIFFVFCEVKLRQGVSFGNGLQAITRHKREKMVKSAQQYLQENSIDLSLQPRFDVFSVQTSQKNGKIFVQSTELIENAFGMEELNV
jgi:putative endonuclease